ncbi:hypothetical protein FQU75_00195 [Paenibacillus polymyxa]|nr:hypothetical protein FQU75_00195 [Paenibacillus polymyxa]
MAAFGGLVLTIKGRNLQAKVQAGQQLKFSRMGLGDGIITSQSIPNMTGLITERKSIAVNRVYTPSAGRATVSAILSNQDITTGFFFRELGIFAIDPDEGEIMYAYGNSGSGSAEYIPPTGGADLIEKLINVNLLVGNATNISITTDQSLVYVTIQDLKETLQEAKEYTDTKIADVKVPDATTTQKGIVKLSADYKSTSSVTVPNSKALSDLYGISLVDRGKPFSVDWNFMIMLGMHRIDVASLNPTTDHSPPGAYTKGVLFVYSVTVGTDAVFVQKYVDETGGIFNRIRTSAGTWATWVEIGKNLRAERAIELGMNFTTAGPSYIDFHSSGTGNDYDSRIIAEGGTAATGNGKLTLQAATTALTGQVETSGQVWVAKNTQFGSASGLSLPIGDSDTGFKWVGDGYVEFYSNASVPVALKDGQFIFKNAAGGYEVLSTAISDLKQSSVDKFTKIANAINGKGGNANSGMTGDQFAAAILGLPVKRFARGTFNGQSATAPNVTSGASMNVGVNNMSFLPTKVFIRLRMKDEYGNLYIEGIAMAGIPYDNDVTLYGRFQNRVSIYSISQSPGGFTATINSTDVRDYAGGKSLAVIEAFEWFAYE